MDPTWTRRSFLTGLAAAAGASWLAWPEARAAAAPAAAGPTADFPRTDRALVETFVTVAHRDAREVLRLVEPRPWLARAAWDWGFGDWETALGAAAHTGGREVAEIVLANGAPPTLFSAAMLGQLDVVRAIVAARPGSQRIPGPHGLTLMHHARAGGRDAEAVVAYLESLGDADERPEPAPLAPGDRDALVGRYAFGAGDSERLEVDVANDRLGIRRPGHARRFLTHLGGLVFFPSGVPTVRVAFAREGGGARLTVTDADVVVQARREP